MADNVPVSQGGQGSQRHRGRGRRRGNSNNNSSPRTLDNDQTRPLTNRPQPSRPRNNRAANNVPTFSYNNPNPGFNPSFVNEPFERPDGPNRQRNNARRSAPRNPAPRNSGNDVNWRRRYHEATVPAIVLEGSNPGSRTRDEAMLDTLGDGQTDNVPGDAMVAQENKDSKRSLERKATAREGSRNSSRTTSLSRLAAGKRLMVLDPNVDPESQRVKLEEQLTYGTYECMICCEEVKRTDYIWSCTSSCFNIFHLTCISTWACSVLNQPDDVTGDFSESWRCPACQIVLQKVPNRYFCFCGKKRNPEVVTKIEIETSPNDHRVPHTCGQLCLKRKNGAKSKCPHKCKFNCHPGPCPPCVIGTSQSCACGKTSRPIKCGDSGRDIFTCENICGKQLSCHKHRCTKVCHEDKCPPCEVTYDVKCHCGNDTKTLKCSKDVQLGHYSCTSICGKKLSCGSHECPELCHSGPCPGCQLSPEIIQLCPCGKKSLSDLVGIERKQCTDAVATCGEICGKELFCGPEHEHHRCPKKCHNGKCSPCDSKTILRCNCGKNSESVQCKDLDVSRTFKCSMKCNKKLSCGRHRCNNICCRNSNIEHSCSNICNKKLSCGTHHCQDPCHGGPCRRCWNVTWDEVACFCGSTIIYPPIHCGTQIPQCDQPCTRSHPCGHPVDHPCHSDESCPPCTFMSLKPCFGGHETSLNVLCYMEGSSCGKTCGKKMSCNVHECQKVCHDGPCGTCSYPCLKPRSDCDHPCGQPCHEPEQCPKSECKVLLNVHCTCKRLQSKMSCHKVHDKTSHTIPFALMAKLQIGHEDVNFNVQELIKQAEENKFIRIECDKTCLQLERNKVLANALDVKGHDLEPLPAPNYTESLKQSCLSDLSFVTYVHDTLTTLVNDVNKQSSAKFKFYNFPAMRSDLRSIIHEYSEFFGCKSHSNDPEPHRSVTVKAAKGKCFVPSVSVMDVVKKERAAKSKSTGHESKPKNVQESRFTNLKDLDTVVSKPSCSSSNPVIDYFDFTTN